MKLKKRDVTIGSVFGRLAFLIFYIKIFSITSSLLFNSVSNGLVSNFILLLISIFSIMCFIIQSITFGYYIESYLINHGILKRKESEDNNII